jgi:hypothetical protein
MADSIRTETLRTESAKRQLELQQDKEVRDLQEKHKNDLERVIGHHVQVKTDLEKAYEIELSTKKDEGDKKLEGQQISNAKRIQEEKMKGDEEVEKTRSRYQEQIARYRENSEKALEDIRRKTDETAGKMKRAQEKARA